MSVNPNLNIRLWLLLALVALQSCATEPLMDLQELNGKWTLVEAKRNRKITQTLTGTYFVFKDGMMTNNITESEKMVSFEFKDNRLVTFGDQKQQYLLKARSGDTILLNTKIQSNKFDLLLLKEDSHE